MSEIESEPQQPPKSTWKFVRELRSPLWRKIRWQPRALRVHEADLSHGVTIRAGFQDDCGLLDTAYRDLERFLNAAGIRHPGPYSIVTHHVSTPVPEAYRLVVGREGCEILAGDTEGIRRAMFFLEDEILRSGGPFLPLGTIKRRPVIRTRISRCYFSTPYGALTDDVSYYPEEYLNRLAHEGVNGLWLGITFSRNCRSTVIPEHGREPDVTPRIHMLRRIVERCARYGIKIYLFGIEPHHILADSAVAKAHPELLGHKMGFHEADTFHYFCTSNPTAQAYLEEVTRNLFTDVPGLGGLINISVGEGGTHCYSGWPDHIACPRCASRRPRDVLNDTMAAMERGMHAASPDAELISWPYTQYVDWGQALTVDSAGHLPKGVCLLHNFESAGEASQCGHRQALWDYWLSWAGPSKLFRDCARAAVKRGNRMFAKLQVGNSHEVATAPFVPAPGQLYRKYRAMHALGVSGVMQCWDFGNYPGVMTRAAGELAFAPLPKSEDAFLRRLARRDWGQDADIVARAWTLFQRGYSHFPMNHVFGWLGPAHDAPAWPLHLEPADRVIAPTYALWPESSGDRIGECFAHTHTLAEVLSLCRRMADDWNRGVVILKRLLPRYRHDRDRRLDIGVAVALGIQFESAYHILRFYALREDLPHQSRVRQLATLKRMRALVKREIARDVELLELCRADSRLGFHSSVKGYKYFPAKIRWRKRQLEYLRRDEFPRVESQVRRSIPLWPEYTGRKPTGSLYRCRRVAAPPAMAGKVRDPVWAGLEEAELTFRKVWKERNAGDVSAESRTTWRACYDRHALYIGVNCPLEDGVTAHPHVRKVIPRNINTNVASLGMVEDDPERNDIVRVLIEPRRLWPNQCYEVAADGTRYDPVYPVPEGPHRKAWSVVTHRDPTGWFATFRIPWICLCDDASRRRPIRIDVERTVNGKAGIVTHSWMERHPLRHRLVFLTANPADLGWLIFSGA
ncbi:MAG: hypothetical protein PHR35_00600 [Kiritimatiellae bacterium]|nr:hypothetical protein [Kiritimatiellia bacterium]